MYYRERETDAEFAKAYVENLKRQAAERLASIAKNKKSKKGEK